MSGPISFGRLLSRIIFVVLIIGLVSAPQLLSRNPGPLFAPVKALLQALSLTMWIVIIGVALAVLWAATNLNKIKRGESAGQRPAAETLPISEAVKPQNNGTGLASISYSPTLNFLNILGWLPVRDPDKECIVIDGKHVIRQTGLFFAPMLLLGKPINARRVLLSPPPFENITATGLTSDQLNLTLVVSVKLSVNDPVYVASLSAPLMELQNLITGVIVEQVHSHTLEDIVKDDGKLRLMLRDRLAASTSIQNHFTVHEVLKALPTGDERILEIIRKTREALQKQALIEQEGQNRERVADFDLAIKKKEAQLKEDFDQKQHAREMEMLHMQQEYEAIRELMRTIAQIAASGVNPGPAIKEIRSVLSQTREETMLSLPKPDPEPIGLIQVEQKNLELLREKIGFESYEIESLPSKPESPGCVIIHFREFELFIDCPIDYPATAPIVSLKTSPGKTLKILIPWFSGSNLTDAITTAVMQAKAHKYKA